MSKGSQGKYTQGSKHAISEPIYIPGKEPVQELKGPIVAKPVAVIAQPEAEPSEKAPNVEFSVSSWLATIPKTAPVNIPNGGRKSWASAFEEGRTEVDIADPDHPEPEGAERVVTERVGSPPNVRKYQGWSI